MKRPAWKRESDRRYREKNQDKIRAYRKQRKRLERLAKYGLTPAEYDEMVVAQEGRCAICREPCDQHDNLSVDHDHGTGAVRGLLCAACNAGIGRLRDDVHLLRAAVVYLEEAACTT